jgi:hypothetical protein
MAMIVKISLQLGIVATLIFAASQGVAQTDGTAVTRADRLEALAEDLRIRDRGQRERVLEASNRLGMPLRRELPNGRLLELQRIVPGIGPVFYITNNVDAADTVSTDEVWPGGAAGLWLDGSGMTVGEWDGGAVFSDHPDFTGRLTQVDGASEVSNHSTHVAGTLVGSGEGLLAESRGMAYAARLDAYDWNSDTAEMALAASGGLLVSNHSYGIAAGWLYIGGAPPDTWWWIGGQDPADVEDPNFGYYDSESRLWDQIAWNAPYYLIVKAAGNDRVDIGPAPGEEYTVIDQDGAFLFTSTLPRTPDCAPDGYDCMPGTGVAKNVLTVGAVDDLIGGYSPLAGPPTVQMADFSSWGPTDDGRIKPDLVGNGIFLMSAFAEYPWYAAAAGTSMAAPNVTGSLLLLQQHYEDVNGTGVHMRAATLKALAIHTADETGDSDGPDYEFGWGLLNTRKAAQVISEAGVDHRIIEGSLANGATDTVEISVSGQDNRITATLVWTDPPATPVAPALDPPDLMLVNDLDLRVTRGPTNHRPWVLDPSDPAAAATQGDNFRDNVEQVVVAGTASGLYSVEVSHKGALLGGTHQDYSLIISVEPLPPDDSRFLIDEDFSGGLPAGWSIETVSGADWAIRSPVPGDSRLDNLTGGSGPFAMVDNDYRYWTDTSLRTPSYNLADAVAVILRFRSYFVMDTYEAIYVDISKDGGSGWTNVWQHSGFNPYPTHYVLDLSGEAAGEPDLMLRFRYDSLTSYQGDLWQIDDIELEVFGNSPAGNLLPNAVDDSYATQQDVAFSANVMDNDDVGDAPAAVTTNAVTSAQGVAIAIDPSGGFSYTPPAGYTGVDSFSYTITDATGDASSATAWLSIDLPPATPPDPATGPTPADGAAGVDIGTVLSWIAGDGAASHTIYLGTLSPPSEQGSQTGNVFDPGSLEPDTTYYWRIDEVNAAGATAGTEWTFTTAPEAQITDLHLKNLTGSAIPGSRNRWSASVELEVVDGDTDPVQGVLVEGQWSNGTSGGASCTTGVDGRCAVLKNSLKANVDSVVLTVNNLTAAAAVYIAAANEVPNVITVFRDGGGGNLLPVAVDDAFTTVQDTTFSANVMANDEEGDGPATVTTPNVVSAQGVAVAIAGNGDFSYTPPSGYTGPDSFDYAITDDNGDSDSATVAITVAPPSSGLTLSVSAVRDKGIWHARLIWSGGSGSEQVTIMRDGREIDGSPTVNDGEHLDPLGKKVSGTRQYEVCDSGGCAVDTVEF